METFTPKQNKDGTVQIQEFPNAEKFIQLNSCLAHQVAGSTLHLQDLKFAHGCLMAINGVPDENKIVREALWRSAITYWYKCFGDNKARRYKLQKNQIYDSKEAFEVFEFFKNLRNKHLIHDENSYSQCLPGAVINKKDASYKIEKIIASSSTVVTLEQEPFSNLDLLIKDALAWTEKKFDALCLALTNELEAKPYEELIDMPQVKFETPKVEDINKSRKK